MRYALSFVLLAVLPGCGSGPLPAIQAHAASEMKCEEPKLKITRDKPEANLFTVEGCGQIGRYWAACNIGGYCPNVQGEIVSTLVVKQASFDLKCAEGEVQLSTLNHDTFGARGCGRQASYIVQCGRGPCRVVQNTQAQ